MPSRRKHSSSPGKFLANATTQRAQNQKQQHTRSQGEVDKAVKLRQGMSESSKPTQTGSFVNLQEFDEQLNGLGIEGSGIAQTIASAVEAAMKAAIPSIVAAVKDACIKAVKEEINPHLLRTQFKHDELDQNTRRENLRIAGIAEGDEEEESEESLTLKICKLAREVGVEISPESVSSCHRFGKKTPGGKVRQTFVRFTTRRMRDSMFTARFKLKGNDHYKGVFINEDLTPLRYALLMRAKNTTAVKGVSTRQGNIVCKMDNNEYVTLRSPDDLFDIGCEDVKYNDFKLHLI